MVLRYVYTSEAPQPVGPYSQALSSNGLLFLSGQLGIDPKTGEIVSGGVEAETHQIFKNLTAVLKQGNSSLQKVIKCTVFLKNLNDFAAFNKIYETYFQPHKPARSTFSVVELPKGGLVEIELVAESA